MNKILITLMTVLAITAFTACESKNVETAEDTTASVAEETTAATEAETTTEATTEAKTTTEKETEAETESEVVEDIELFKGTGYTLEIDGDKWLDGTEYLDRIAKLAENSDVGQSFELTAEDVKNMGDAIYFNISNGSNFNVTVAELGVEVDDETIVQIAAVIQEQYNSIAGCKCGDYELVNVNGYRALKFEITNDAVDSTTVKLNAYLFYPGTKQICVTFTSGASDFDETVVDFEEVLNTISFE